MTEYVFKLPDLGEGTVESEIAEWFVKVGDSVSEEDVVGTMMTDKAAVELSSPVSGKVIRLAGEPGDVIAVGSPLVVFETDSESVAKAEDEAESTSADATPDVATAAPAGTRSADKRPAAPASAPPAAPGSAADDSGKVITSPAIRRRAKEAGIDLAAVPGSGPNGRILRRDLDNYLQQRLPDAPVGSADRESGSTDVKIIGLRRMIAERMSRAKREIPHFSYVEEIDITELESLRRHLNRERAADARLTLLPFLGLALVRSLRDFPQCNTTHDREHEVLIRHQAVHLGVATQTGDGLKVPVVKHAERRSLDSLAGEIRRVSEAARNNSIKRDELSGSTITITSLGKLGGIVSTPVINQPEVAIIGVNRAVERPVVVDGQIAVRTMMNLSSSFDHRFVDGYDAAAMIQRIREILEHPARLFMPD